MVVRTLFLAVFLALGQSAPYPEQHSQDDYFCYHCDEATDNTECKAVTNCLTGQNTCLTQVWFQEYGLAIVKRCAAMQVCYNYEENNPEGCDNPDEEMDGYCSYCCDSPGCNKGMPPYRRKPHSRPGLENYPPIHEGQESMKTQLGYAGPGGIIPGHIGLGGIPPGHIGPGGIPPGHIGPGGISPGHIGPEGISPGHIGLEGIPPDQIGPGGILPGQIGPGGISSGHIGLGGISPGHIGPGGISPGHIGPEGKSLGHTDSPTRRQPIVNPKTTTKKRVPAPTTSSSSLSHTSLSVVSTTLTTTSGRSRSSSTSTPTVQARWFSASTPMPAKNANMTTTTVRSISTIKTSTIPQISTPTHASGVSCQVCGDWAAGVPCNFMDIMIPQYQTCGQGEYCMTDAIWIDKMGKSNLYKRCVSEAVCNKDWYHETSDKSLCIHANRMNPPKNTICHYCCTKPKCNQGIMPDVSTLFRP